MCCLVSALATAPGAPHCTHVKGATALLLAVEYARGTGSLSGKLMCSLVIMLCVLGRGACMLGGRAGAWAFYLGRGPDRKADADRVCAPK